MDPVSPKRKKQASIVVICLGVLALILGLIPGWLAYQWGIIIFVFSLVVAGIVKIVLPDPEPEEGSNGGQNQPPPQAP